MTEIPHDTENEKGLSMNLPFSKTVESQQDTTHVSETNRLGREVSVTEKHGSSLPSQSPQTWEGIPRICARCGSEFLPNQKSQRFCSHYCAQRSSWERKKLRIIESGKMRICPVCQKSFFPFNKGSQIYCSISCFHKRGKLRK